MPKKEKVPKPRKKRAKQDTEEGDMYFDYSQIQYDVDEAIKEPHSHVSSNFAGMLSIFHASCFVSHLIQTRVFPRTSYAAEEE